MQVLFSTQLIKFTTYVLWNLTVIPVAYGLDISGCNREVAAFLEMGLWHFKLGGW